MPFSKTNLDVDIVSDEINCTVCPNTVSYF